MRVLLAHNFFYMNGGAEVFFLETGRVLEKNGHEVAYFSIQNPQNKPSSWETYFGKDPDYNQGNVVSKVLRFPKMVYSYQNKRQFIKLLEDFQPDIVHVFAIYVRITPAILDACREEGIPVVMSCNDYKLICPNYKLFHHNRICFDCEGKHFYRAIQNKCCKDSSVFSVASALESYINQNILDIYRKNVKEFLFASEFMASLISKYWGNTFKWGLLRNPYNTQEKPYCPTSGDYLLYFGRMVEEKGIPVLLKAMQYVPQAKLILVGDGIEEELYKQLAKDLNLTNVTFVGPKWGAALEEYLQRARFVVIPSIWHENFPYVVVQSFAFGKAVIGSDKGGIPELVKQDEFGLVYPAMDSEQLSIAIKTLWENPEKCTQMGLNAKLWVDSTFNDEVFYQTLQQIYNRNLS
ncbi:MAG: glycosyltransferase [Bacteroidia bacterium]|nr:glycosyltransferase [Bacteroidia bacterium]